MAFFVAADFDKLSSISEHVTIEGYYQHETTLCALSRVGGHDDAVEMLRSGLACFDLYDDDPDIAITTTIFEADNQDIYRDLCEGLARILEDKKVTSVERFMAESMIMVLMKQ